MSRLEVVVPLLLVVAGCTPLNSTPNKVDGGGSGAAGIGGGAGGGSTGSAGRGSGGSTLGTGGIAGSGSATGGSGSGGTTGLGGVGGSTAGAGGGAGSVARGGSSGTGGIAGGAAGTGGSAAGTTGSAGRGGSAGTAGVGGSTAGTTGSAGRGGSSGTAGVGGSTAGTGGSAAGATGSAGRGGSSGTGGQAGGAGTGGSPTPAAPPRLIAPLSTATVTSQRPTLHWKLATGTDGAHIEICRDRACTVAVTSFDAAGASGAPSANLPAGVLFWRAYGRSAGANGTQATPTWEMIVGARTAPVNTSWGTTLDVNGDGYADVIVGAFGACKAYLYLGSTGGLQPSATLNCPDPTSTAGGNSFGLPVASAGDVNGDGYADVIITDSGVGRGYLYLGGASGLATTPKTTLTGPDADSLFGYSAASAGDVNGDGYADVIISGANFNQGAGRAYVYLGGTGGLAASPATTITGPDGANGFFGSSVASAGDVNGDGYADVIVGAPGVSTQTGRVYLYLGGAAGLAASATASVLGPDGANGYFGGWVASADDVNGDGYADVMVGAPEFYSYTGSAYLFTGNSTGISATPATTVTGDHTSSQFGSSLSSAGDVDGDGYADVVIGASGAGNGGMAYLYRGGAGGLSATATTSLASPDNLGYFGTAVAGAGDVNGDGRADVMVAAPSAQSGVGQAYLYLGKTTGLPSSPSETLTGIDPAPGGFGQSLAAAQPTNARPSAPARSVPSQRGSRGASDRHRLVPARTARRA